MPAVKREIAYMVNLQITGKYEQGRDHPDEYQAASRANENAVSAL